MAWFYTLIQRDPPSNKAVVDFVGVGPGDRVLDIGFGPGAGLEHAAAAGAEVSGVDPTDGMVKRASLRVPGATVVKGSAEHLEFEDGAFTHVWSISAYHHWAYPVTGVEESFRVLGAGGKLYLVEHKLKPGKDGHGLNSDKANEVKAVLEETGFVETTVDVIPAKRKEYVVVSGTKPTA